MDDQYKDFPAALTVAREAAGLTQKELGDKIGKSQQAVAKWENNESNPTRRSMGRLIEVLPSLGKLGLPSLAPARKQFVSEPNATYAAPRASGAMHPAMQLEEDVWDSLPTELQRNIGRSREVDYESAKAVIEICSFPTHPSPLGFAQRLWRLATLRLKNNDKRDYYLLAVRKAGDAESLTYQRQKYLAQYTAEANLHGITVLTAESPLNAAEIIHAIESDAGDPTTNENFYEDQDPHE